LILWISANATWRFWRWRLRLWRHPDWLMEENTQKSEKKTLLFIRHGQSTWNVEQILPGQLPGVALTEVGRKQAQRLAESLAVLPITSIISSPLERAYDTAASVAGPHNLPVLTEDGLKDTDIAYWAGQKISELVKNDPAWKAYTRDPTKAPEGIETFPQVQQRVVAAVEHWLKLETTGNYPAFVAHADVVKLLLAYYMGLDLIHAGWLHIENASVSMIEIGDSRPHVVAISWNPRPDWLKPPRSASTQIDLPPGAKPVAESEK
jgi:broad specificity phosphatase PhoE